MANAPVGAQAATLDVEAAFRTIPVLPAHKAYTVVSFRGLFWLDHVCPFGAASSGGNHGEVADATVDIWDGLDVKPVVKWVDDFTVFRFPSQSGYIEDSGFHFEYSLKDVKSKIETLGVPWHPDKGQDFGDTFTYVGFYWDIANRSVALTDAKRQKFKDRVDDFISRWSSLQVPLHVALLLSGSLSHIAFVYPHGRSYIQNVYSWIALFPSDFRDARRFPSRSMLSDLAWWSKTLANPSWSRPLRPKGCVTDLGVWVDASTEWGVGIILGNGEFWDAWRLTSDWKGPFRNIGWLEAVAVEFAVRALELRGVRNTNVLIRSDNQGVIGAWQKGRGRNFEVNLAIRRASVLTLALSLSLTFVWVESAANLADPISRGELGSPDRRLPGSLPIPAELSRFFTHA